MNSPYLQIGSEMDMSRIDEIQQKILELEGIDYIEHGMY